MVGVHDADRRGAGLRSLVAIRFLFGAGEAGAFPNAVRSFSQWFPSRERGMPTACCFSARGSAGDHRADRAAAHSAMGLEASASSSSARSASSGRSCGIARIAIAQANTPTSIKRSSRGLNRTPSRPTPNSQHPRTPTPWRNLLTSPNLYAICAMYFAFGYGLYFYFTWLPTYLIRELRFSLLAGGFFSSLPFLLAGAANITGGWCTDALARTRGLRVARVMLGFSAFSLCAVLILGSILVLTPVAKRRCWRWRWPRRTLRSARAGPCASTSRPVTPEWSPAS